MKHHHAIIIIIMGQALAGAVGMFKPELFSPHGLQAAFAIFMGVGLVCALGVAIADGLNK
jgi:hypothetical protein